MHDEVIYFCELKNYDFQIQGKYLHIELIFDNCNTIASSELLALFSYSSNFRLINNKSKSYELMIIRFWKQA